MRKEGNMSDFVYLFRSNDEDRRERMGTPERAQQTMQVWLAWMRELEANGHLKSPGQPLDVGGRLVRGKAKLITDGPYVEAKDMVLGFIVVQARDLDEATEIAKGCPILGGTGSVEIRPVRTLTF
jgi:hypothetical protein